jgi:hypothetical protein
MLSSPRHPDSTIRIFSSDDGTLRAARRMSFTTCSAGTFVVTGFFVISTSMWGKDEPHTRRTEITQNWPIGADRGHDAENTAMRSGSCCSPLGWAGFSYCVRFPRTA